MAATARLVAAGGCRGRQEPVPEGDSLAMGGRSG